MKVKLTVNVRPSFRKLPLNLAEDYYNLVYHAPLTKQGQIRKFADQAEIAFTTLFSCSKFESHWIYLHAYCKPSEHPIEKNSG